MNKPAVSVVSPSEPECLLAHQYLRIYRLKLTMAEDGTTPPNPAWEDFMRRLVAALRAVDPNTPIRLDSTDGIARFINARTGQLMGEFLLRDAE